jgi:Zn-dependent peptidase ImmA (M78 family)
MVEPLEDDISGFLFRKGKKMVIAVNEFHPKTRQRFTAAHEIGHFQLKHGGQLFIDRGLVNFRDSDSSTGEIEQEREANAFAAELLMPEEFLRKDLRKRIDIKNQESLEKLAKKYEVSLQALTFRLVNLGLIG